MVFRRIITSSQMKKMKKRNKFKFIGLLLMIGVWGGGLFAQKKSLDSNRLSFEQYQQWVLLHHPIARQASLIKAMAKSEITGAKGSFDPKLYYNLTAKNFNDKRYYQSADAGVKMVTPFGVEWKAGYENNTGLYLNPENLTPSNGLLYTQISLPLLQGLLIDERRAALNQARILLQLSATDQQNMINDLMLKSGKAYLDWQLAYSNYEVYAQAYQISSERYKGVVQTIYLGDRPAIDSIEAKIQLQDRWLNLQQAELELQNKKWLLSGFLWSENIEPVVLNEKVVPAGQMNVEQAEALSIRFNMEKETWATAHPMVNQYQFKSRQLAWDKRLKQDKLKPVLNVHYSPLNSGTSFQNASLNNYKWGITAAFPLLLRKERGALQLTKLKIEQNNLEWAYKKNEQLNKIRNEYQNFVSLKTQQLGYADNVIRYEQLWKAEKKLFDKGESSLFMINSRELSYIGAQVKQNELINKYYKSALEFQVASGQIN